MNVARRGTRVLIIVQNLPVPLDRRVWLECKALMSAGYTVSVICPKGPGDPSRQLIDGVGKGRLRIVDAAEINRLVQLIAQLEQPARDIGAKRGDRILGNAVL